MGIYARLLRRCFFLLALGCAVLLVWFPDAAMAAVQRATMLCLQTIVPALFPFLVVSSLLVALLPRGGGRVAAPLMGRLFGLNGTAAAALLLGLVGGYPVGARVTAELYQKGLCSRTDAAHLLTFCNNSGPGFLLGIVGVSVFGSTAVGWWLYLIHVLSALLIGFLSRPFYPTGQTLSDAPPSCSAEHPVKVFTGAVTSSFFAVLNICAFVIFFMVSLRLLSLTGLLVTLSRGLCFLFSFLGTSEQTATAFLAGLAELSTGALCLQGLPLSCHTFALSAFLLGWGGASVHCQTLLFLLPAGLPCRSYLTGKLLQGCLSALFATLLFPLLTV